VNAEAKAAPHEAGRGRIITAHVLVVLASLTAVIALLAGFVRYQAFDTPTFKKTAADLIADDTIRTQVATTLVDQLYSNVDVQGVLEKDLPPGQQRLAGPLSGVLRELANRASVRLLERPRIQALWVEAAAQSQQQLLRLLENRGTVIKTEGGVVVLDLRPLVVQLGNQVAIVNNIAGQLPPNKLQITIIKSDQLKTAQDLTSFLKSIGSFFFLVPLLLAAAAIWLARGRRRKMLREAAIGAIIAGFLVLVLRAVFGSYVTNHLVMSDAVRPAVKNAWAIMTQLLADGAWTLIFVAAILLVGVWIAGETQSGTSVRRALAGPLARAEIAFGSVALFVLALVWWGPTPQARRWFLVLALAIILAIGVEALRRQSARESAAASDD
jgi:hypothetical protein